MERTEVFDAAGVKHLQVKLHHASAAILCSNVEQFEIVITGQECDELISAVSVKAENGRLCVSLPYALTFPWQKRPAMQVRIFVPTFWKGAVTASTCTGSMEVVGVSGTDVTLRVGAGSLNAAALEGIRLRASAISGDVSISGASFDDVTMHSLSGSFSVTDCDFRTARFRSVTGGCSLDATGAFDSVRVCTATGSTALAFPFSTADAAFRAVSSRMRTCGVDLAAGAPDVRMSTITGELVLSSKPISEKEN